eukprot:2930288-Amphidinium_carterae.1
MNIGLLIAKASEMDTGGFIQYFGLFLLKAHHQLRSLPDDRSLQRCRSRITALSVTSALKRMLDKEKSSLKPMLPGSPAASGSASVPALADDPFDFSELFG